ncbi:hypothetical protein BDSB_21010 [Burkholderia dolosa PC543]|nr:hypothetical protein BDSB_21010 [Burkholderia dolosa PC543]
MGDASIPAARIGGRSNRPAAVGRRGTTAMRGGPGFHARRRPHSFIRP